LTPAAPLLASLTSPVGAAVLVVQQLGREVGDGAGDAHVLGAVGAVAVPCSPTTPPWFAGFERLCLLRSGGGNDGSHHAGLFLQPRGMAHVAKETTPTGYCQSSARTGHGPVAAYQKASPKAGTPRIRLAVLPCWLDDLERAK
jgi:hypothetical protein